MALSLAAIESSEQPKTGRHVAVQDESFWLFLGHTVYGPVYE